MSRADLYEHLDQKQRKTLLDAGYVITIIIAFATFFIGSMSIGNSRLEPEWFYIIAIDVLGAFICAAMYRGCMSSDGADVEEDTQMFASLLRLLSAAFLSEEISWYVQGVPELRLWNIISNTALFTVNVAVIYYFWSYVRHALELEGRFVRWADYATLILMIPALLAALANLVFPVYFSVSYDGIYTHGRLFALSNLYLAIVAVIVIIALMGSKAPVKQKRVVIAFIAIPLAHYALTINAFGTSTQYGAILVAVVLMYSVLFSSKSKRLAATQTELDTATNIQAAMLPSVFPPFPDKKEIDLYASMHPAKEVGGDFYDFFLIDDDHLCLVMADVSGKGVPAALFMMASKIMLSNHAMMGKTPAQILEDTNDAICANNTEEMFVTVWLGILEISTGKLTAANAGHDYPAVMLPGGDFDIVKRRHGFVVGGLAGIKYQEYEVQLTPGTKVFIYTDGVPEATDAHNEMFGAERMIKALNEAKDANTEYILTKVKERVDEFVGEAEQFDDLTMLCIEYKGAAK